MLLELLALRVPNKSSTELQQLLLPADPSTPGLNQSYICKRPCFASLEKVLKTKEKITQLNDERDAAKRRSLADLRVCILLNPTAMVHSCLQLSGLDFLKLRLRHAGACTLLLKSPGVLVYLDSTKCLNYVHIILHG